MPNDERQVANIAIATQEGSKSYTTLLFKCNFKLQLPLRRAASHIPPYYLNAILK